MLTKLEAARRRKSMTVQQLATAAGCSASFVSYVENGYRKPSDTLARKLASAVDLPNWKTLQKPG